LESSLSSSTSTSPSTSPFALTPSTSPLSLEWLGTKSEDEQYEKMDIDVFNSKNKLNSQHS